MTSRPLNSDELGAKGESKFREICADAQLICNSSDRDRTGWDFIVEFPFSAPNDVWTLDKRKAPISCHFQVKTVWEENDRITMRLSSAERLAKEPKPAFVYVLRANSDFTYKDAYCIHISGSTLATILKRLRKEQSNGHSQVNKKTISFSASKEGKLLDVSGNALRKAIVDFCNPDPEKYTARKISQLESLGFEKNRYQADFTLRVGDKKKLVDVFLGKEEAEVVDFKAFETRFGISLPVSGPDFKEAKLIVTPEPADRCKVIVRDGSEEPAIFDCDAIFSPPPLADSIGQKILIRADVFEITITSKNGDGDINLKTTPGNVFNTSHNIEEWINYTKLLLALSRGSAKFTITPEKFNSTPIQLTINTKVGESDSENFSRLLRLFAATSRLLKFAGASNGIFTFEEITDNATAIFGVDGLIRRDVQLSPMVVKLQNTENSPISQIESLDTLVINFVRIGSTTVGYSFTTNMTPIACDEGVELHSGELILRTIQELRRFPEDFDTFTNSQKAIAREKALIINHP